MRIRGRLCFAAVFLCVGVCFAAPHPRYRVVDLGVLPGGIASVATALNDNGEVVGDAETPNGVHAFLFSNGSLLDLNDFLQYRLSGTIFNPVESHARDINNRSEIIGWARNVNGAAPQFLFVDGAVYYYSATGYPVIDNTAFPIFYSINDFGHIEGLAGNGRYAVTDGQSVWFYPSLGGTVGAHGLNNHDEAAGFFAPSGPTFTYRPVLLRTNALVEIELPEGGLNGTGWDLNDAGHVAGSFSTMIGTAEVERVFLYRDGVTIDVGSGRPTAINNFDEVVGFNENGCFVYTGGRIFSLNELIRPGRGFDIQQANDINNDGVIAGSAIRNGQEHAVVLIPLNRRRFHKHIRGNDGHGPAWWMRALTARERR